MRINDMTAPPPQPPSIKRPSSSLLQVSGWDVDQTKKSKYISRKWEEVETCRPSLFTVYDLSLACLLTLSAKYS